MNGIQYEVDDPVALITLDRPETRIGLVARVFPDDSFCDDSEAVVSALLRKSPAALRGLKQHYVDAERMGLGEFVHHEAKRHLQIAASADTAEAFKAFVEKREPRFG